MHASEFTVGVKVGNRSDRFRLGVKLGEIAEIVHALACFVFFVACSEPFVVQSLR